MSARSTVSSIGQHVARLDDTDVTAFELTYSSERTGHRGRVLADSVSKRLCEQCSSLSLGRQPMLASVLRPLSVKCSSSKFCR